jgi:hypothetical protein
MGSLYELTGEFQQVLNMAQDGEYSQEAIKDTLEAIGLEIEDKADGYAKVIKVLEGNVAALKAEESRLAGRRKDIEDNIAFMKKSLEDSMRATGKIKFKTLLFNFGIQKNPPRLVIDDKKGVPEELLIPQEPVVNGAAIKELLKNGENLEYAHLEQGESLRIK